MSSPYTGLPPQQFWKTGVADQHPLTITGLYRKKFTIGPDMQIATAGSCFAQHIATHMRKNGFTVIDAEPAPRGLNPEKAKSFGYELYSARYGNIYTVRQMLQLTQEAFGKFTPSDAIWSHKGRYYDAMRPSVEPNGLETPEAVSLQRSAHLKHVRRLLEQCDLFIFTFGLTEAWVHKSSGTTYPTAPGTIAGSFDPETYAFKNFTFPEIHADFLAFRELLRSVNPSVRFLITVSPVPLTATAAPQHVLQATTYSKSVLRAVAGQLAQECDDIDYFPSYELIASPFSRGFFYESNLRAVNHGGVESVMRVFFAEHGGRPAAITTDAEGPARRRPNHAAARGGRPQRNRRQDVVCEEELLEAFAE